MADLYKIALYVCLSLFLVVTGLLCLFIGNQTGAIALFEYLDHVGSFLSGVGGIATTAVAFTGIVAWKKQLVHGKNLEVIWEAQVALRVFHVALQQAAVLASFSSHNVSSEWLTLESEKSDVSVQAAQARFSSACTVLDKLVTRNKWEWQVEAGFVVSAWHDYKKALIEQAPKDGVILLESVKITAGAWDAVESQIQRIEGRLDALRDEYS